jgi:HSP20 family protein
MNIDIACVGVDKKDLDIKIEGDILRVEYKKDSTEEDTKIDYIQKGIARRAFNMGWRISRRYDLGKLDAKLENGLLQLHMPITTESKPKKVTIK